jgi:hypothetical protein
MTRAAREWAERRAEPRAQTDLPGRAYYGDKLGLWADCRLKDVSENGAKLQVPAIYVLPPRFVLLNLGAGVAFDVLLRWRRSELAGVSFEHRYALAECAEPRLAALKEAWLGLRSGFSAVG